MKFRDNSGASPVELNRGYEKLEGDPPHSGENILHPRHVEERKRMEAMRAEHAWPDEKESPNGPDGFLGERNIPTPYERPNRSDDQDRG